MEQAVRHNPELLTTSEVAEVLRVSPGSVRLWIRQKKLPALKVGRQSRVTLADLMIFLAHHCEAEERQINDLAACIAARDSTVTKRRPIASRVYSREEVDEMVEADRLTPQERAELYRILGR